MRPEELVHAVLGTGYFGGIDAGDMRAAVSHVAEDVEMVFDPEDDLRGRAAVLAQLEAAPASARRFHRIHDVLAAERDGIVVGLGSLETTSADYRFAVVIERQTRQIAHFVTQLLPRPG